MKKMIFFVVMLLLPVVCQAEPSIVFDAESHDFGKVSGEELLAYDFDFTNSGNEILVIERVGAS